MTPPILAVALASIAGCAGLEQQSSGHVGCPPSEITISDAQSSLAGRTWTAQCRSQTYYCSTHGGGDGSAPVVACSPATGDAPGGAAAVPAVEDGGGCSFDTQCKGDRVCEQGACVSMTAPEVPEVPVAPEPPEPPPEPEPAPAVPEG